MFELERLQSHLLWLGVAMDLIGFQTLFMLSWKDREIVMDCQEMISGARVHKAMNTIGGARRDIPKEIIPKIETKITELKKSLATTINTVANDSIIKARTKGVGLLTKKDAINLGVVGPTARASGVDIDVRRDDPYAAYDEVPFKVITRSEGDVLAKVEVRLGEIKEALGICEHCLDVLQSVGGQLSTEVFEFGEGDAFGKVEALRGELVYYISSNGTNVPNAVRMRTPSFNNNASIPYMLREQTIADAPIIIGSIDPCFSCTDRLVELEDIKTHRRYTATLKQLSRKRKRL
jgi:NADH-quinone oxidoreductase subunit D